ncbi:polysaccharide deacetylase family protein [Ottowia caeni]|uniref:polysaccharide deacetylase family protein n=1 Tax=Ottowia caeni TaxID=2870339 RepID=UPI001E39EEE7|nr:polysaccharide deacetylase family protein [Ottowia caeni]
MNQPPNAPWRPSSFLQLSAATHLSAGVGAILAPQYWPWWLGAVLADHAVAAVAGLLPRTSLLGANLTRLPVVSASRGEVSLTFDDGPDPEVTPRVLDLLEAAGHRASFFCIAERVRQHPELAREIIRRGHLIENHTDTHPHLFATYGPRGMARQIDDAQQTLQDVTGRAPLFFRAVAGLRNPFLDPILTRRGLRLASWTRRAYDTRTGDGDTVLKRLVKRLAPGDILLMHDGHAARGRTGCPVVLEALPPLLQALGQQGLRSVTLQAACMPEGARHLQGALT